MIKGITLKEIVDQTKVEAAKVFEVYNIYQTKLHNRAIDKKDYTGLFNNPIKTYMATKPKIDIIAPTIENPANFLTSSFRFKLSKNH